MKKKMRLGRGFTLAELLIVVAIIAVLTAVAIPVFAAQLEKSREATDTANIRGQYSEVMAKAIETGESVNLEGNDFPKVQLKQRDEYWQNSGMKDSLLSLGTFDKDPAPGGVAWVSYTFNETGTNNVVIHFSGESAGGNGNGGGSGGGEGTKPTAKEIQDATDADTAMFTTAGFAIYNKMSKGSPIELTVSTNGDVTITQNKADKTGLSNEDIYGYLLDNGAKRRENGTVYFPVSPIGRTATEGNSIRIHINHGNNNESKVTVSNT